MVRYQKAEIKNQKFKCDKKLFQHHIETLPEGKYLLLLIKQSDKTPREFQNTYFAMLGEWSNSYGWTKQELHELIKEKLFPELFEVETSTTELSIDQWQIVFFNLENFLILHFENQGY